MYLISLQEIVFCYPWTWKFKGSNKCSYFHFIWAWRNAKYDC